ncbi:hypothetical protein [Methylobacterium sp. Gmos1]
MTKAKTKKIELLKGRGRRPLSAYRFDHLHQVGDSFTVGCSSFTDAEKVRKRNSLSGLCRYYRRKFGHTYRTEITGDTITVQLVRCGC